MNVSKQVTMRAYVYDDPFAEVMVVRDGVEVVLARVLRVLVNALLLMSADFWQRSRKISVSYQLIL